MKYKLLTKQKPCTCKILRGSDQGGQIISHMDSGWGRAGILDAWTELDPDYLDKLWLKFNWVGVKCVLIQIKNNSLQSITSLFIVGVFIIAHMWTSEILFWQTEIKSWLFYRLPGLKW
jgi:hypothetical protein